MPLLLKPVEPARGTRWIGDACRLFARRPLAFSLLFTVFLFAMLVVALLPLVGGVLQMALLPLLSLGFMVASQSALLDGPVTPAHYIEPLRRDPARRRALLLLCLIYGLAAYGIVLLFHAWSDNAMLRIMEMMNQADTSPAEIQAVVNESDLNSAMLGSALLVVALSIPFWHAPALVHWGGQGVAQALFSSALAIWRCKGAFLVYMLGWAGLSVLAAMLGTLVAVAISQQLLPLLLPPTVLLLSTLFYVSLIFTFNDSFGGAAGAAQPPAVAGSNPPPLA